MQNVTFGSLTARSAHQINFEVFDVDKDGIITQEELTSVLEKNELDVLDLSVIDKDADQKVTEEEYILWQQESEIHEITEKMKEQASKDLVGKSPADIKKFMDKLSDYEKAFEEEYKKSNKDISQMSKVYKKQIPTKYSELRRDVLMNTQDAIKERVIENVISRFLENDKQTGGLFMSYLGDNNTLSDNAKRLLSKELGKEADKFIKKYDGDNLEEDLTAYLIKYLSFSDKEKLAGTISVWEKGKEELAKLPAEVALMQAKDMAKNFILQALEQGITPTFGNVTIRTEVAILPALAQFNDKHTLVEAVDKIINELSEKNKIEELNQKSSEGQETTSSVNFDLEDIQTDNNIFQ